MRNRNQRNQKRFTPTSIQFHVSDSLKSAHFHISQLFENTKKQWEAAQQHPIPLEIHQTYKSLETIPVRWKQTPDSWQKTHPHWKYTFWSDQESRLLIERDFSWFLPFYDSYPYFIQRVDAWRLFALFKYGGVYIDLDLQAKMNPENDQTLNALFLKTQKLNRLKEFPDMFLLQDPFGPPTTDADLGYTRITNCFIASKPFHPLLLLGMKLLCERAILSRSIYRGKQWWSWRRDLLILHTTGPGLWSEMYRQYRESMRIPTTTTTTTQTPTQTPSWIETKKTKGERKQVEYLKLYKREISKPNSPFLPPLLREFFSKTLPFSFSASQGLFGDLETKLRFDLNDSLISRPNHIAIIPSGFFFPIVCYFFIDKPCCLPSTYAIQLEGHSWVEGNWSKKCANQILKFLFWLQTFKNNEFAEQILHEIHELEQEKKKSKNLIQIFASSSKTKNTGNEFEIQNKQNSKQQKEQEKNLIFLKKFLKSKIIQKLLIQKTQILLKKRQKLQTQQKRVFSPNSDSDSLELDFTHATNPCIRRFVNQRLSEPVTFHSFLSTSIEKTPQKHQIHITKSSLQTLQRQKENTQISTTTTPQNNSSTITLLEEEEQEQEGREGQEKLEKQKEQEQKQEQKEYIERKESSFPHFRQHSQSINKINQKATKIKKKPPKQFHEEQKVNFEAATKQPQSQCQISQWVEQHVALFVALNLVFWVAVGLVIFALCYFFFVKKSRFGQKQTKQTKTKKASK